MKADQQRKKKTALGRAPKTPETSVIIPAYNAEEYIAETIQSISDGRYSDFEIIVVDDGSVDDTLKICKKLSRNDDRIRTIPVPHSGVSAARNAGVDAARGMFIAFVDADDYVMPDYLQLLVGFAKSKNADYVGCGYIENSEKMGKADKDICVFPEEMYCEGEEARRRLSEACLVPTHGYYKLSSSCMAVFRKSIIDEHSIRFREEITYGEDTLFVYTYAHYIERFAFINRHMYVYRKHQTSSSNIIDNDEGINVCMELIDTMEQVALSFGEEKESAFMSYKIQTLMELVDENLLKISRRSKRHEKLRIVSNYINEKCNDLNTDVYHGNNGKRNVIKFNLVKEGRFDTLNFLHIMGGLYAQLSYKIADFKHNRHL